MYVSNIQRAVDYSPNSQTHSIFKTSFFQKLAFFIDLKEKKEERSLPELILPEDYQKGRREDGKKNVSAAIRVIFDNPDDCLFIIGQYFYHYWQILEN